MISVLRNGANYKKRNLWNHSSEDEPEISLSPKCKKQGWDSILRERVYLPGESIPSEDDIWKQ